MSRQKEARTLQIVIRDEESGEEVAHAAGVETLILLVAPDTLGEQSYRHLLLGDADLSVQILFEVFRDIAEKIGQGTTLDLTDVMDDRLLLEMTEGLLPQ